MTKAYWSFLNTASSDFLWHRSVSYVLVNTHKVMSESCNDQFSAPTTGLASESRVAAKSSCLGAGMSLMPMA